MSKELNYTDMLLNARLYKKSTEKIDADMVLGARWDKMSRENNYTDLLLRVRGEE